MNLRSIGLVCTAAFALGCSETSPSPPHPDAGAGTSIDATVMDASGDVIADAPADATLPDASHWCEGRLHLFCDDFDEDPLTQSWDGIDAQQGSILLDTAAYTSPAHSFLASTSPLVAGGVGLARMGKRVADLATDVHFVYDVHPDALDPSGAPAVISSIQLFDGAGVAIEYVDLLLGTTGASVDDHAPSPDGGADLDATYPIAPAPPVSAWTRVEVEVLLSGDAGAGRGTITVRIGAGATPAVDHVVMLRASQPAFPLIFLGVAMRGPSQPVAVRFDDVTFDVAQ